MPFVVKDRVKVTSTTTGTGAFTLGAAVDGFQDFGAISSISNAWNISAAVYSEDRFSVVSQESGPEGLFFKPDGTKMYVVGAADDEVNEYDLSSAWDITTASFLQNFSVSAQDITPSGLFFKPDGVKMYVTGVTNDSVYEYDLSTAWDISSASYLQAFSVATEETAPRGLFFKPDGTKMYVVGTTGDDINEYDLGTPWNISTSSYVQNLVFVPAGGNPNGVFFKPDGTKMYVVDDVGDEIDEYTLGTSWNISTASYLQSFSIFAQSGNGPTGVFFKPDGSQFWVISTLTDAVFSYYIGPVETYYAITDGTDWEVGIGTVVAGIDLVRNTVLESSNSNALVNWGAGDKDVFCTYPADATEGTVPQGDTSQVGTDLVAWTNLKKELDRTVINGVPYNNNNTAGVVSTYSLVFTAVSSNYTGGVLAPNGDIHFIPYSAPRGEKISLSGVVSTYSIIYQTSFAYWGGVLAPNGDIHFVPHRAARGQKVNASGVVSTYSLVYTNADGAYSGGVLAPNGDIHFVPYETNRGQKISAAGVVSTYSLVYTAPPGSGAYSGGVLAPNGDIHFVPLVADRGQKVSSTGVVSTYSLVYTTAGAYNGGVLAPNGDIHFVPYNANRGQKVSAAGVVSTYSLVYTTTLAYSGGVLAPNGDIHFVPYGANRGQKVSAAGVVSTYSLVYTVANAYRGGVLTPSGDIHFISNSAVRGQKISTGTQRNIGYALSPFFNKF
jgi:sugar lactone lactonase YvrE